MFKMGEDVMRLPLKEKMKFEQGDDGNSFGCVICSLLREAEADTFAATKLLARTLPTLRVLATPSNSSTSRRTTLLHTPSSRAEHTPVLS